jgi:hypothetical protein
MGTGDLVNWDEAGRFLSGIENSMTRRIVDRAMVIAQMRFYAPGGTPRTMDFDLLFLAEVLCELFRDHEVIRQELDGKRPGAWSADPNEYQ